MAMSYEMTTSLLHVLITFDKHIRQAGRFKSMEKKSPQTAVSNLRRCKTSLVGQSTGLSVLRVPVQFWPKNKTPKIENSNVHFST